ncbi:MAG: polymer-forming cytoskeletal protein [Bacteroidota bacterium]|nr:polymer-forming cytoskeletal protein [Bacteroidota bacterium]
MLNKNTKNDQTQNSALNMIGVGTVINGDISSEGDIRIDGIIEGKVISKSKIAMGISATIKGDVNARSADISGKIVGDIEITETLYLRASSKITGNIKTNKLVIESGSEFNGTCMMNFSSQKTSTSSSIEK